MNEREELSELAKRRGFFFPANEPYGGTAGFYVYGPQGASLKANIENAWRDRFTIQEGHMEIESPTVMPEPVFEASGHLEGFDDMLIECSECHTSHRADHLVEAATALEDAETLTPSEITDVIAENDIQCPTCGAPLADQPVEDFNLMFATNIGPGTGAPGYLRPETAQGMFVEFPRLAEYARNQLPFGVTQIGPAYRNEISPRRGLVRLREFTQAELELFIDPDTDDPPLDRVADVDLTLYPASEQHAADGDLVTMTVQEAVDTGTIASDWIAYYLGAAIEWYAHIGIDMDRFRYRQHLAGERAHYAADCWDAETEVAGDWIEVTGFADRADYDLRKHGEYADEDYTIFQQYDTPTTTERATVNPEMSALGPEYGDAAPRIADALDTLAATDPGAFDAATVTVTIDNDSYDIPTDLTGFAMEETTIAGEHLTPHVIEPSFGVDRLVYTILAHAMTHDEVDEEPRTVLQLPAHIAPTFVGVFPLMTRDTLPDRATTIATDLRDHGFTVTYDDTGSIGRRYRRQDEIGTPYCITVDYDTLEDDTVTIRDRDTATQRRVPITDLPEILTALRDTDAAFTTIGAEVADI